MASNLHVNPSPARDQQFVVVVRRRPYCLEEVSRVDAGSRQCIPHGRDHGVRIAPDAREINLDIVRAFRCGSKRKAEAAVDRPDLLVGQAHLDQNVLGQLRRGSPGLPRFWASRVASFPPVLRKKSIQR